MIDEAALRAVIQSVVPVCPTCDYAQAHCRCPRRCPTCGNAMVKRDLPPPERDGMVLLVCRFRYVCPCCDDAEAVRREQVSDPRGDAWPEVT